MLRSRRCIFVVTYFTRPVVCLILFELWPVVSCCVQEVVYVKNKTMYVSVVT
jgi:hypothetical protein